MYITPTCSVAWCQCSVISWLWVFDPISTHKGSLHISDDPTESSPLFLVLGACLIPVYKHTNIDRPQPSLWGCWHSQWDCECNSTPILISHDNTADLIPTLTFSANLLSAARIHQSHQNDAVDPSKESSNSAYVSHQVVQIRASKCAYMCELIQTATCNRQVQNTIWGLKTDIYMTAISGFCGIIFKFSSSY